MFLLCQYINIKICAYLGPEGDKLGVDLVVILIERAHVLGVGDEPVDGGEVFTLSELFVETPEDLYDTEGGRGYGVGEVSSGGRYTGRKFAEFLFMLSIFAIIYGLNKLFFYQNNYKIDCRNSKIFKSLSFG